jgi:hypothetical protein
MPTKRWIFVREDGQLVWHEENNSIVFLRKGSRAVSAGPENPAAGEISVLAAALDRA